MMAMKGIYNLNGNDIMSNEKPKPIIIKSNKGEDTFPLPITKETDWDDTNQLTNQELKDIYQQTKEDEKLKNNNKVNKYKFRIWIILDPFNWMLLFMLIVVLMFY